MPKTSPIHIRVEPKIKEDVEKILNTLLLSAHIQIYLNNRLFKI